jgi:hypothetical protein
MLQGLFLFSNFFPNYLSQFKEKSQLTVLYNARPKEKSGESLRTFISLLLPRFYSYKFSNNQRNWAIAINQFQFSTGRLWWSTHPSEQGR